MKDRIWIFWILNFWVENRESHSSSSLRWAPRCPWSFHPISCHSSTPEREFDATVWARNNVFWMQDLSRTSRSGRTNLDTWCVRQTRVQPEPASSQFSKHSLLITFALSAACGGLRRPAVVGMRSYVRNTESAGAIVPMLSFGQINACQRSNCTDVRVSGSGTSTVIFCAVSSRTRKNGSKTLRIQSPTFIPNPWCMQSVECHAEPCKSMICVHFSCCRMIFMGPSAGALLSQGNLDLEQVQRSMSLYPSFSTRICLQIKPCRGEPYWPRAASWATLDVGVLGTNSN